MGKVDFKYRLNDKCLYCACDGQGQQITICNPLKAPARVASNECFAMGSQKRVKKNQYEGHGKIKNTLKTIRQ